MASSIEVPASGSVALSTLSKVERKRQHNRVAQRRYRELDEGTRSPRLIWTLMVCLGDNQKSRLHALESALAQSSNQLTPHSSITPIMTSLETGVETQPWTDENLFEPSPVHIFPGLGRTALHRAICSGNESMTRLLLQRGADPAIRDDDGNTALHLAAQSESDNLVSALLSLPADLDATNYMGRTALSLAVEAKKEGAVQELLKFAANPALRT
jgi:ankyrin repeat protein